MRTSFFKLLTLALCSTYLFQSCNSTENEGTTELPLLSTNSITAITQTTAKGGGTISYSNNVDILVSGICWSLEHNPSINDSISSERTAIGSYTLTMRNLIPDTTYYVRAYATSNNGVGYGQEVSFKTAENSIPNIITTNPTTINNTSFTIGATFSNQGGLPILSKGFCWSETNNPTLSNNKIETNGSSFSTNIINLKSGDTYYVKAYATNSKGTGYGNTITVTTKISDVEGHVYHSVKIGTQTWMVENLKTGKYRDGKAIPFVTENSWEDITSSAYNTNYGYKYNGFAASDSANLIAPEGWHVPTLEEWNTLFEYIGGVVTAGSKLKQKGTSTWPSPNSDATDTYGFCATPQGYCGAFTYNTNNTALWWTRSEDYNKQLSWLEEPYEKGYIWGIEINSSRSDAVINSHSKYLGVSVRCIRDN